MLKKPTFFLFIFLYFSGICYSQNQANIWYFGSFAGVDFNSGSPVSLSDGAMTTNEGCATICDSEGELLFYTDGTKVYNKNHSIMPNGTKNNQLVPIGVYVYKIDIIDLGYKSHSLVGSLTLLQ
jgi:hypothetical protein